MIERVGLVVGEADDWLAPDARCSLEDGVVVLLLHVLDDAELLKTTAEEYFAHADVDKTGTLSIEESIKLLQKISDVSTSHEHAAR